MKFKEKLFILLVTMGVLIVLIIVGYLLSEVNVERQESKVPFLVDFDALKVFKLQIEDQNNLIPLIKENEKWILMIAEKKYPANKSEIESLFQKLSALRITKVMTINASNWYKFDVTDTKAVKLKLFDSNNSLITEIWVGKSDYGMHAGYLRKSGSDDVILSNQYFMVTTDTDKWSNLRLFNEDIDNLLVDRISVSGNLILPIDDLETAKEAPIKLNYTIYKKIDKNETQWRVKEMPNVEPLDQIVQRYLITSLTGFSGQSFAPKISLDQAQLNKPNATISFTTSQNKVYSLDVGKKINGNPNRFYVKNSETEYIYLVNQAAIQAIFKDPKKMVGVTIK